MFVYKKNSLQRRIDADGTDRGVYTLTHTPTNVSISYEFQLNNFNPDVNLTMKEGRVAMTKPFIIYKKSVGGERIFILFICFLFFKMNNWYDQ